MPKPIKGLLAFILVAGGVGLFFFVKMYRDDIKALKIFRAAYDHYDVTMAVAAAGPNDRARNDEADEALDALGELQARAELRLCSLIKNDGELMLQARAIAELAAREYQSRSAGREDASNLLSEQRKTAFRRFVELSDAGARVREAGEKP